MLFRNIDSSFVINNRKALVFVQSSIIEAKQKGIRNAVASSADTLHIEVIPDALGICSVGCLFIGKLYSVTSSRGCAECSYLYCIPKF